MRCKQICRRGQTHVCGAVRPFNANWTSIGRLDVESVARKTEFEAGSTLRTGGNARHEWAEHRGAKVKQRAAKRAKRDVRPLLRRVFRRRRRQELQHLTKRPLALGPIP